MTMRRRAALAFALALPCAGGAALAADYPIGQIREVMGRYRAAAPTQWRASSPARWGTIPAITS